MFSPARSQTVRHHGEVVAPVLRHIEAHLEEPLPLEELAAVAGFSAHHFHRVFRQVTGEAPKEYVRRLRLERAVYRLKISPDNVLRIALEAGFGSNETFTRAFVRQFDVSPSEFRSVLREYRAVVGELGDSGTFEGFTADTPLTLRFDMRKAPVTIERTPGRHLLCVRHHGYEHLLTPGDTLLSLWDDLFAYARSHGVDYSAGTLVGITHDDPYVTDEDRIRFDACIEVADPIPVVYPVEYLWMPPRVAVARRHGGGLEEVAKTFAHIGVDWVTSSPYALAAAPPFLVFHTTRGSAGDLQIADGDSFVPLEMTPGES